MHQVAAAIWNAIAKSQELRSPSFKLLMAMTQSEISEALDEQATALEKAGAPDSVINAYQQMAPILAEHEAISAYINQTGRFDLRAALPEILNVREAVSLASIDRFLSIEEQRTLFIMLTLLQPPSMGD